MKKTRILWADLAKARAIVSICLVKIKPTFNICRMALHTTPRGILLHCYPKITTITVSIDALSSSRKLLVILKAIREFDNVEGVQQKSIYCQNLASFFLIQLYSLIMNLNFFIFHVLIAHNHEMSRTNYISKVRQNETGSNKNSFRSPTKLFSPFETANRKKTHQKNQKSLDVNMISGSSNTSKYQNYHP